MKNAVLRWLIGGSSLLAVRLLAQPAPSNPIPLADFFAEADASSMRVSPDGHYLAFLTTLGYGKVGVALMDLTGTKPPEPLVSAQDENIKRFLWKGNDHILYSGDIGGDESPAWRSVPVAPPKPGTKRRVIALSEAYRERYNESANFMEILDSLRFDPVHVLAWGRYEVDGRSTGLFLVDVRDGRRSAVAGYEHLPDSSYSSDSTCVADNNGVIRARRHVQGDRVIYEVRPEPKRPFVKVADFPAKAAAWEFRFFASDNETLYLLNTEHTDTPTLHSLNVRTGELSPPIFHPDEGEIEDVLSSWDHSKLYGVVYNADKLHYQFFDPDREKLQRMIDQSLPGTWNAIISASQDEAILVIAATSDRDPGTYYVLDRKHGRLGAIGKINSRIDPARMRPMEPIHFVARDGLTIHGYLTRPADSEGKRVPLILHPHGGPFGIRDDWGFDNEVQFLASRGYAVLQVNYRGSGGYGGSFERAGYHEWGGKMQDDLTDAVKWAIAEGIADPARVAIYGASYGGYAALAGLVYTPELYCCGVNYVGVADLALLTTMGRNRGGHEADLFYGQHVGDDSEYVRTHSPLNFVERIRVPLLNAYGYNDPRVDFKQWTRLESKLKQYNKPYEILIEENEGHGFRNESNRLTFYRHLEAFLDKNLRNARVGIVEMGEAKVIEMPADPKK